MNEHEVGFWEGIMDVARGRGQFRLLLQPLIAIILGVRLGIADAKEGKDPFLLRLFVTEQNRARFAKQAASDVIIPFVVAIDDASSSTYALGYAAARGDRRRRDADLAAVLDRSRSPIASTGVAAATRAAPREQVGFERPPMTPINGCLATRALATT
jgi:hypothetical protein